jgi:hypothetical protein
MKIFLIKSLGIGWNLILLVSAILLIKNVCPLYLMCVAGGALAYYSCDQLWQWWRL